MSSNQRYALYWAPDGRCIGHVDAPNPSAAIRKAPNPYRKYLGEISAHEIILAGTRVRIRAYQSKEAEGLSYPEGETVLTKAFCLGRDGWAVVELADGTSVYSFSIERV